MCTELVAYGMTAGDLVRRYQYKPKLPFVLCTEGGVPSHKAVSLRWCVCVCVCHFVTPNPKPALSFNWLSLQAGNCINSVVYT